MATFRSSAPTVPEIKKMGMGTLLTEMARMQGAITRMERTLRQTHPEKRSKGMQMALERHEKALVNLSAEVAARYDASPQDRKTVLFKLMGSLAMTWKAWIECDDDVTADDLLALAVQRFRDLESLR